MKIALFLNPSAGSNTAAHDLPSQLTRHGHKVVHVVAREAEASSLVDVRCDLVVVAGGDGTVGVAARAIADRGLPMAILPLGTANNVALTLGIDAPIDELIDRWHSAEPRRVDYGHAAGPSGPQLFIESVGSGLVTAGIADAHARRPEDLDRSTTSLARTAQIYRDALARLASRRSTIDVDGTRFSGDFLLIEVLNSRFVGPNLVFAAEATPTDGALTVVFARGDQRPLLDDYLRHRIEGTDCPVSLPFHHGRHVEVAGSSAVHVDDEVQHLETGAVMSADVVAGGLEILL